jgi:hypothetical protein
MEASEAEQSRIANKLNCKLGSFPFIYLGLPISDRHLTVDQWNFLVANVAGRVEPWMGRFLASGGRLILSNSCLASLSTYAMGLFLLQDGVHTKLDSHRAKFFWEGAGTKRKFHMVNWPAVCRPKECGGLGIINSKKMNIALMTKWIWRLSQPGGGLWKQILRAKYQDADNIFAGSGHGGSPFWKSLHKIKALFKLGARHEVRDGSRTFFWLDWWCGEGPLKDRFPALFAICDNQFALVQQVCEPERLNIRFRRLLDQAGVQDWLSLLELTDDFYLSTGQDRVSWSLESNGQFSVNLIYCKLVQGASAAHFKLIWAARIPLKIRIFSWQLVLDRLPTALQLQSRHGPSNGNCALCGLPEDASHIFFLCSMAKFAWSLTRQLLGCSWCPSNFPQFFAIVSSYLGQSRRLFWILFVAQSWALWQIGNKLAIEAEVISHPSVLIYKMAIILQQWAINSKASDREGLEKMALELKGIYTTIAPSS